MKSVKFLVVIIFACLGYGQSYAQLKKTAEIEKVKSFTNGSVALFKTKTDGGEFFAVKLSNNSKYFNDIVLYLGNKDEMLKNLKELSEALEQGKKGDVFDFTACGKEYQLSYGKVLGQVCFKVSTPLSASNDFGRFFKSTIDDIIEYYHEENCDTEAEHGDDCQYNLLD